MTLAEDIELLTELLPMLHEVGFDKYKPAITLGIEALKYVHDIRHICHTPNPDLMPGETKE